MARSGRDHGKVPKRLRKCPKLVKSAMILAMRTATAQAAIQEMSPIGDCIARRYSAAIRYPARGWVRISGVAPAPSSLARSRRTYTRTYSVSVS